MADADCDAHLRLDDDGEAESYGETDVDERLDAPFLDDTQHAEPRAKADAKRHGEDERVLSLD